MVIERKPITMIVEDGTSPAIVVATLAALMVELSGAELNGGRTPVAAKVGPAPRNAAPTQGARAFVAANGNRQAVAPVVYKLKPNFDKAKAKALTASNAKVFAAIRGNRGGMSTAQLAKATGVLNHTVQSNVYQLRHAGLIESHRVGA